MTVARQSGLTLIETLVAFAILSGIVVSVAAMIGQATRFTLTAEDRLLASIAADNLMTEELASTRGRFDDSGEIDLGGRRFVFEREAVEAADRAQQVTYAVRLSDNPQTLARASMVKLQ